jgi:hypothetical protein
LTKEQRDQFNAHKHSYGRRLFNITSATGMVQEFCYLLKLEISIGGWSGTVQFVLSSAVNKHMMVLGRDFLKRRNVIVDHGKDTITVEGVSVNVMFTNDLDADADRSEKLVSSEDESLKKVNLELSADESIPLAEVMPNMAAKTVGHSYLCGELKLHPNSQMLADVEFTNFRTDTKDSI